MRHPALLLSTLLLSAPLAAAPALAQPRPEAARPEAARPNRTFATGIDQDPATLLRLAEASVAAGRLTQAREYLEHAESRLLTRTELASEAGRPARSATIATMAEARAALARGDRTAAASGIATALARVMARAPDTLPDDKLAGGPSSPAVPIAPGAPAAVPQPWSPMADTKPAL
jgi:hypothetical protein